MSTDSSAGGFSTEEGEFQPEAVFPDYAVDRVLGRGGFGIAYLLRHRETNELVVLKALVPERFWDRPSVDALYKEITRLLRVPRHPNVVPVHHGSIDGSTNTPYLLMEYVSGGDLWSFVQSGQKVPVCDCWWVLLNLAEGMRFLAEDANIVHRDLKPQNMLIDTQGIVKVSDFGLARVGEAERTSDRSIARVNQSGVAGTLPFMSPEQVSGASEVDERSDIWSMGVSLYWLTTGTLPFRGGRLEEEIVSHEPTAPSVINPGVDKALESIILRCLNKDKANRYQSFRELELTAMASVDVSELLADAAVHTRMMTREAVEEYLVPYFQPQTRPVSSDEPAPDRGDWLSYFQRILNLIQMGDVPQADQMVEDGLARDPDGPMLLSFQAMILARKGHFEQAAQAFDELFEHTGNRDWKVPAIAYAEAMQLHMSTGRYDRARAVHRRAEERLASETDPDYRRHFEETIHDVAARVHHDYDKALAKRFDIDIDYDKMFDEVGGMPETNQMAAANLCKRAIEMAQRGLYERAVQTFREAIGLAPDYGFAWADLGTCLMEMERYPESYEALHRASELVDDFLTWFHLAKVSVKLGRWDEALGYFDEALRLDPSNQQAWFTKGLTLLDELSSPEKALPCFEEAQRLGHPEAATMAGECRRQLER